MPELQLCIHCKKPIYDDQKYVITNKNASKELWSYAHVECHVHDEEASTAA